MTKRNSRTGFLKPYVLEVFTSYGTMYHDFTSQAQAIRFMSFNFSGGGRLLDDFGRVVAEWFKNPRHLIDEGASYYRMIRWKFDKKHGVSYLR